MCGTHLHWSSPHVAPTCTGFPMNHSLSHSLREITQLQSQIILSGMSLHACVCTCVQVCTHICACGGQRSTVGDFFICSLHYCLRHGLSLNSFPTLPVWLASEPQRHFCLCLPSPGIDHRCMPPCLAFHMGPGNPNSSPPACKANT